MRQGISVVGYAACRLVDHPYLAAWSSTQGSRLSSTLIISQENDTAFDFRLQVIRAHKEQKKSQVPAASVREAPSCSIKSLASA